MSSPDVSAGFRIALHTPASLPSLDDTSVTVSPGRQYGVGFKVTDISRVGHPHGNCTTAPTLTNSSLPYSTNACIMQALQTTIGARCNCTDISLPHKPLDTSELPFCRTLRLPEFCGINASFWQYVNLINESTAAFIPEECKIGLGLLDERMDCVREARSFLRAGGDAVRPTETCFPPCSQTKYDIRDTNSDWPASEDFYHSLGYIISQSPESKNELYPYMESWAFEEDFPGTQSTALQVFRSSFVQLDVFLEDDDVTSVREQVVYEWYQLLSEIGGLIGLYIGMSVMTACEIIELIITSAIRLCTLSRDKVHPIK